MRFEIDQSGKNVGKRVAVGLSGGVDSAVAAYLLKQQGYEVHCIYLNCFDEDVPGCRTKEDRKDALAVALHLKLSFQVLDFQKEYQATVIDYFKSEYEAGRTPNPDVVCNRDIKFGLFYDWAIAQKHFDRVATGHYARFVRAGDSDAILSRVARRSKSSLNGRPARISQGLSSQELTDGQFPRKTVSSSQEVYLSRPKDEFKDQTYFLWQVSRERFSRVLFPLGDYLKSEVRDIARKAQLPVAGKKDSTGICFIGEVRVEEFLKRLGVREKEGEVVMRSVIGSPSSVFSSTSISRRSAGFKPINRKLKNQHPKTDHRKPITEDVVIGRHKGVWFYTIGQRHGFEVNSKLKTQSSKLTDKPPLYVIRKDAARNRLIVGFGAECYRSQFSCGQLNWLIPNDELRMTNEKRRNGQSRIRHSTFDIQHCLVRIRHGGELIPCSVIGSPSSVFSSTSISRRSAGFKPINRKLKNQHPKTDNRKPITVFLSSPQRGLAPGQSAVFYLEGGVVMGGGVIQ